VKYGVWIILEKLVNKEKVKYTQEAIISLAINLFKNNDLKEDKKENVNQLIEKENEAKEQEVIKESEQEVKENNKKKLDKKTDIEDELDDNEENDDDSVDDHLRINYSLQEEQLLAENFYKSNVVYEQILYENKNSLIKAENNYSADGLISDTDSEVIEVLEAEENFKEIQLAAVAGYSSEINGEKRRKLDLWIKFNPDMFKLFETLYAVTGDVNYGPL